MFMFTSRGQRHTFGSGTVLEAHLQRLCLIEQSSFCCKIKKSPLPCNRWTLASSVHYNYTANNTHSAHFISLTSIPQSAGKKKILQILEITLKWCYEFSFLYWLPEIDVMFIQTCSSALHCCDPRSSHSRLTLYRTVCHWMIPADQQFIIF